MSVWVVLVAFYYAHELGSLLLNCHLKTEPLLEMQHVEKGAALDTDLPVECLTANNILFTLETLSFSLC
jgi:hypothetical protein